METGIAMSRCLVLLPALALVACQQARVYDAPVADLVERLRDPRITGPDDRLVVRRLEPARAVVELEHRRISTWELQLTTARSDIAMEALDASRTRVVVRSERNRFLFLRDRDREARLLAVLAEPSPATTRAWQRPGGLAGAGPGD